MEDFEANAYKKWLEKNGFNEDETTYIVCGNSYSIKNELKKAGFIYSDTLKWHAPSPQGYDCIEVKVTDCFEKMAWGIPLERPDAKQIVRKRLAAALPAKDGAYYLNIGDRFYDLPVTLEKVSSFNGFYGKTYIYNFVNGLYIFTWLTTKLLHYQVNDTLTLTATIKDHSEYQGQKITYINRGILKEA